MKISLYSCINSVFISILIFTVIYLIRRKYSFSHIAEVFMFLFLYALGFSRLFLPLDFNFTKGIPIAGWFSDIFEILFIHKIHFIISAPVGYILIGFVTLISVYKLIQCGLIYHRESSLWITNLYPDIAQINAVNQQLREKRFSVPNCTVLVCADASVPMVFGIRKPQIILPDIHYSQQELYYILLHEYSHINNKDLLKKLGVEVSLQIFWWLPLSKFIKNDLEQSMEINCDQSVLDFCSNEERISYTKTLIKILKCAKLPSTRLPEKQVMHFAVVDHYHDTIERFQIIAGTDKPSGKVFLPVMAILLIFIASYLAAPIPSYESPPLPPGQYYLTPENSFLTFEGGKYYVISGGQKDEIPAEHAEIMLSYGFPLTNKN